MRTHPATQLRNYRHGSLLLISALLLSIQIPAQEFVIPATQGLPLDVVLSSKLSLEAIALWSILLSFSYCWRPLTSALTLSRLTLLCICALHVAIVLQQNTLDCFLEATSAFGQWLQLPNCIKGSPCFGVAIHNSPPKLNSTCTPTLINGAALVHNLLALSLTFQPPTPRSR
ncbi:MAG: hypothetical protein CL693_19770 [Cellvibrionaceae bacterium]|nr:hypothetical protein [Cellvibrionaceae bacterium]|tara:strand:+ start:30815 stop:31330 length:516 start_codon:yes stop_codon:yes gene_type:complete